MNTIASRNSARRWASVAVLATLGGAIAIATWIGGDHILAVMLGGFYVISCAASYLWSRGSGDVAAIMRLDGDERRRLSSPTPWHWASCATAADRDGHPAAFELRSAILSR